MLRITSIAAALALLACACGNSNPEGGNSSPGASAPPPPPPSTAAAKPSQTAQSKAGAGEIAWDAPKAWKDAPNPNAMRIATYFVGRADGDADDAEMSVSRVGGGIEANIGRWKGQFSPLKEDSAKRFEREVAGLKVTIVEMSGAYTGMFVKGQATSPKEGWSLLAAIVEPPSGDPWFFKMTGPAKTIAAARADFDGLVNSFRPK